MYPPSSKKDAVVRPPREFHDGANRDAWRHRPRRPALTNVTEQEAEDEDHDHDDGEEEDENVPGDDVGETFATAAGTLSVAAQKLKAVTLGRGWTGKPKAQGHEAFVGEAATTPEDA